MTGPKEGADEQGEMEGEERRNDTDTVAWEATLDELVVVADERRDTGWEVLTVEPVESTAELPEAGETDQFGLVYTLSNDDADELAALLEETEIDEFETYRRTLGRTCFLLTELRDTTNTRCVLVAGAYDVAGAEALADHAVDVGHLFSQFQRLDGSVVAAVRHDASEKLLPPSLTE